ncbi:MAG: tagaturonate epimerase family protein [Mariniblastus sp.]|nr:tagaturonate epimerase family protein [Mariniblastus sp.]
MALIIEKFSFGVGDRFAHQGKAQLAAIAKAAEQGVEIVPVWNKSNREHQTIGSEIASCRVAADAAVEALGWEKSHYVDADHINLKIVDPFLNNSDFYTIDVADAIGAPAEESEVSAFIDTVPELIGSLSIPGIPEPLEMTRESIAATANQYLKAVKLAGEIYRYIASQNGEGTFVTEVSMDETDSPQTPPELLVILAAIAQEGIPIQTIAPKFTGRFNKGVDYVGDVVQFEKEFEDDLAIIAFAVKKYGLPENLKLSVHSGSDKFSIYGPIRRALAKTGAGLHIKTAGTTWLEELIGLAEAGGAGLEIAKEVYAKAFADSDSLCAPYATVIDIDPAKLPSPEDVNAWTANQYVNALRHDPNHAEFNSSFRQLLHVGYKIAAKMGDRYLNLLTECEESISRNVTENLYERHLKPLFLD